MAEHRGRELIVGGNALVAVTAAKTRPNDTNTYASGDVINESTSAGTNLTFSNVVKQPGGSATLAKVVIDSSANVATKLQCELWIFDTAPTADNDNAAFTPTDAEMLRCVAVIPIVTSYIGDATSGAGGNARLSSGAISEPLFCASGSTSLYGAIVARNAYVPVAQEVFTVKLYLYQD